MGLIAFETGSVAPSFLQHLPKIVCWPEKGWLTETSPADMSAIILASEIRARREKFKTDPFRRSRNWRNPGY